MEVWKTGYLLSYCTDILKALGWEFTYSKGTALVEHIRYTTG